MYGVIYCITNLLNGMKYVGQTTRTIEERFNEHARAKTHLGNSIRFHGVKNFSIEIIEECETSEQLNEREIFWIDELNTKHPCGYNFTDGGEGSKGFAEESLEKMRVSKSSETVIRMSVASKKRANSPKGKAQLDKARISRWEKEKERPPEERGWIRKCRKNVYPVLEAELISRKIKFSTVADCLNTTVTTLARKMNGKVRIKVEEAEAIKNFLGSDMTIEELFIRDDDFGAEKTFSNRCVDWNIYPVLKAELDRQKITAVELAKHVGLSRPTVTRKLSGKVGITLEQKAAIKDFLQVDTPLDELFKRFE